MLREGIILLSAFAYLGVLFAIAYVGDRRADTQRSIISNPYVYTLSIAVYCTAWTFYGSVGRAASTGIGFLPIYLGPTLMAAMWWFVLRKIVRISKTHRITSIADFIASRYGKSALLGGLVTVIAVVGILPYISLQLKAVSTSYLVLKQYPELALAQDSASVQIWEDTAFYVALLLAAFTIVFGTRHIDVTERHEGMVAAIAFESVIKLLAFVAVGVYVTFALFDGPAALFGQALQVPALRSLMQVDGLPGGYTHWLALTVLSMLAVMFLPRQFQVAVVENVNEEHLRKACWLFPLYLFVINLFVIPLAFGGSMLFPGGEVDPDTYVLTIPMAEQQQALALFVFLGGLSASTGMVIVATIALSTMVSNDLLIPTLLRGRPSAMFDHVDISRLLIRIRRGTIVVVLLLGYLYFRAVGQAYALVSVGLVSFCAAAQFAPSILLGIYWKGACRRGAMIGLLAGFFVWLYTLLLPGIVRSGWMPMQLLDEGPFAIAWLRPQALFGVEGLDPISHALLFSMLANIGLLVAVSLFSRPSVVEQIQASRFVDAFTDSGQPIDSPGWQGSVSVQQLEQLVGRFLGRKRARLEFERYANLRQLDHTAEHTADRRLVAHAERLLAGAIGAASARVMMASVVRDEELSLEGVLEILEESSEVRRYSRRLEQKSRELEATSRELRAANTRLKELDQLKDEFVSTVSHELRTPLTSIRAFSEILVGNPELDIAQRQEFLGIVVKESARLTRLINDVLDMAKMESGRMDWNPAENDLRTIVTDAIDSVSQLLREQNVHLEQRLPEQPAMVNVDRDRVLQVVINLVSNAAKFAASPEGRIGVVLRQEHERWLLEISDNGPGIPPEHIDHVFDKFHQVSNQQSGKPKGTGLGLPISQHIARHHGGAIRIARTGAEGTCFVLELPVLTMRATEQAAPGISGTENVGGRSLGR